MDSEPALPAPRRISLLTIFFSFFRLGLTAFGGPAMVAYIRRMVVEQNGWLDSASFDDGVALCQAVPGATAMQVTAYAGFRIRGAAGALAAFSGFGLPAFLLMMALSALYVPASSHPLVQGVFLALQAIVVAMVAYAAVSFAKTSLRHWLHAFIAGIAAALFIAGVHPVAVIALAALLGVAILPTPDQKPNEPATHLPYPGHAFLILVAASAAFFLLLFFLRPDLFSLAATMAGIDLFAFGGGFAALPLMFHEVVEVHSWLDSATFINGLALGQVTPGPIVITATFVGYLTYGFWGGVVATIGMFIPSFLMVLGTIPYYDWLKGSTLYRKMFQGVLFSFVGLLLSVTVKLALAIPWSYLPALLAAGAFVSLLLGAEILWVVAAGIAIAVAVFVLVH